MLNNLSKVLVKHLSEGEIVRLGDFGNFQITLTNEGAPSAEKFTVSYIKVTKFSSAQVQTSAICSKPLSTQKYKK